MSLFLVAALLSLIPSLGSAQVVHYYHLDAVGNVRIVTDQAAQVVERHDYLPFGEECVTGPCAANPGVAAGQPRKFTGKERDAETGLDYFGARYYGSKIGRFTSVDPVYTWNENLSDPQRWNRHAYGRNNPLRFVDPDGKIRLPLRSS
jgi:RHS repeat-associated protein